MSPPDLGGLLLAFNDAYARPKARKCCANGHGELPFYQAEALEEGSEGLGWLPAGFCLGFGRWALLGWRVSAAARWHLAPALVICGPSRGLAGVCMALWDSHPQTFGLAPYFFIEVSAGHSVNLVLHSLNPK
eukprot:4002608-Amphidinium_carterae.2